MLGELGNTGGNMDIVTNQTPRSTFVTVVAWIFIVLSGFASVIGALQNIMLRYMMPTEDMHKAMSQAPTNPALSAIVFLMMIHFA